MSKLLLYVGALVTIGILTHYIFSIQARLAGLRLALAAFILGAIFKLLIANARLAGSLSQTFNRDTFGWVWQSNGTQFSLFLSGAFLAILTGALTTHRLNKAMSCLSIAITGAGFAASGHTQGAENLPLLPLWIVPHVLIAGFWIWAPVSLWPHASLSDTDLSLRTDRFSRVAVWAVPVLFVTGVYLFWRLNGNLWESGTTLYGRLLLGKLAAALLILGVGALNKIRIAGLLRRSPTLGRAALQKSLSAEAILFAVVLICILLATTITGPGGHQH